MLNALGAPGAVHITLQGKGGVGKSLVSALLMQYLGDTLGKERVRAADTDPSNQTLTQYEALQVKHLPLLAEGTSRVDEGRFDELVEWLVGNIQTHWVVDTGATSFLPFSNYLLENKVLELLREMGRPVRIHTVITGGQAMLDTMDGFRQLAASLPERSIVVWLNEFFGTVSLEGRPFEGLKIYQAHSEKCLGLVRLLARNPDTFGRDIRQLMQRRLTLSEGMENPAYSIVTRQRYKLVRDDIWGQLAAIDTLSLDAAPAEPRTQGV
jgi:hypothetical protein